MATNAKVFSFVKDTTTGAHQQVITGLGFQPKAVIFFSNMQTATGITADANFMIGISDGTNHKCAAMSDDDTQATTVASCSLNSTNCIVILQNGSTTIDSAGDIDSLDSDGFTIGWNTASATQFIISGIAFGGSDITNVKVMKHDVKADPQSYTGVGFQPTIIFFLWGRPEAAEANPGTVAGGQVGWGAAMSSTKRAYAYGLVEAAQATSDTYHKYSNAEPINIMTNSGGTLSYTPSGFTSMDSDGFTLASASSANTNNDFFTLSIKGGTWDLGTFQKPSTATTQNISVTAGMDPTVVLLSGTNGTSVDSPTGVMTAQCRISFGASDGTTERSIFAGSTDNQATAQIAKSDYNDTKLLRHITETSGGGTLLAECDFSAHTSGQFTINWTTNDSSLRYHWFIALVADTGPSTTPVLQTSIQKYHIAKNIVQTSIQKYNIVKYLTQTAVQKYNILRYVTATPSIQKYNLAAYVLRTNIQKYSLGGVVLQLSKQKYNIAKYLNQTTRQKYDIRKTVAATASIQKYAIRRLIAQTNIHKYNTIKQILQALIQKYNIVGTGPIDMTEESTKTYANKLITKV